MKNCLFFNNDQYVDKNDLSSLLFASSKSSLFKLISESKSSLWPGSTPLFIDLTFESGFDSSFLGGWAGILFDGINPCIKEAICLVPLREKNTMTPIIPDKQTRRV